MLISSSGETLSSCSLLFNTARSLELTRSANMQLLFEWKIPWVPFRFLRNSLYRLKLYMVHLLMLQSVIFVQTSILYMHSLTCCLVHTTTAQMEMKLKWNSYLLQSNQISWFVRFSKMDIRSSAVIDNAKEAKVSAISQFPLTWEPIPAQLNQTKCNAIW